MKLKCWISSAPPSMNCRADMKAGTWPLTRIPCPCALIGDDRDQLRFDRGIDLDLHIAVVGVPIDVLDRFGGVIGSHLGRAGKLSRAVDDSGLQNSRSQLAAFVVSRHAFEEGVGVVSHVARARHTVGEVECAVFGAAKMLVIVPKPWHQEAAPGVDHFRVGRWFEIGVRGDADNAIAAHQHAAPRCDAEIARIEQTRVADDQIVLRNASHFLREASRPIGVNFLLGGAQFLDRCFVRTRNY